MRPILDVARDMGLDPAALEPYGKYKAKVPLDAFPTGGSLAPLVVVTAMTPTPAGEGKTTTAIGLTDALARIGRRPVLTLRQPSVALAMGAKGGGTGGGRARVMPDVDINLHFTGDAHAVASAHNLLAAMADAAVFHRLLPDVDPAGLEWRRVTNAEDRALRSIVTGLGGRDNGPLRETGFDIDAASEVMAVLALASGYDDLRARLGRLVVGYTGDGRPVTAADVKAVGAMLALLRDALKPNLVQTLEGQPALVHAGPFGNIAHGNSSVLADRLALQCGDIVVTEAGFAADLGFEKYCHIKHRAGGATPAAVVLVVTVRALKRHGGAALRDLARVDPAAVQRGLANMEHHIGVVRRFGLPVVVAINRFPDDSPEELRIVKQAGHAAGAHAVAESLAFAAGGEGAKDLAKAVVSAVCEPPSFRYLYDLAASIPEKVDVLAREVYGASRVEWEPAALRQVERCAKLGWGGLPVCMAKTSASISADPRLLGVPKGHVFPISEVRVAAGAGFVYPLAGAIRTMPGLSRAPNAHSIDVDARGDVVGLL